MASVAQNHIDGFLADVRRANPAFNERAIFGVRKSSLAPLLERLRATSANPQRLSYFQARALCDAMDPRLRKYEGAIKNLASVWGTLLPYPGQEALVGRVVFRGDTRLPNAIFQNGFQPWQAGNIKFRTAQQDIDPNTAVAVSPRPQVAANFPLPGAWGPQAIQRASGESYVYACYLEQGYNTAGQQGLNFVAGNAAAGRMVYAGEMATSNIPAHHVIGAKKVMRNFIYMPHVPKPDDWFSRGVFWFVANSWQANPNYTGPQAYVNMVPGVYPTAQQPIAFLPPRAPVRAPVFGGA